MGQHSDDTYRRAARKKVDHDQGDLSDSDVRQEANGAFVQAYVWVEDSEVTEEDAAEMSGVI